MAVFMRGSKWDHLTPAMKQSVRMIVHKLHRVVTGSPFVKDHWDDIGGYAELVARKLPPAAIVVEGLTEQAMAELQRQHLAANHAAAIRVPKVPASAAMVRKVRKAQASLKGAKARPRLGLGTRGIVRAGKPFRKAKAHRRAAKAGK
jgi:hypothetical protein